MDEILRDDFMWTRTPGTSAFNLEPKSMLVASACNISAADRMPPAHIRRMGCSRFSNCKAEQVRV